MSVNLFSVQISFQFNIELLQQIKQKYDITNNKEWSWSYGSWIYNYLCYQCISPLKLWVRTLFMARCARFLWYQFQIIFSNKSCMCCSTNKWADDNVETRGLLFQWAGTIKIHSTLLVYISKEVSSSHQKVIYSHCDIAGKIVYSSEAFWFSHHYPNIIRPLIRYRIFFILAWLC